MSRRRHQGIKASRHRGIEQERREGTEASRHDVSPQGLALRGGARRHRATEGRRREGTEARSAAVSQRRGFSLIEVLLSVFILGIGVISIAALFPAGIAQQRQSVDDITGPIVAQNALAILRTKLRPADFGRLEEFIFAPPPFTIDGDWPWLRPAFIFAGSSYPPGTIDIFNATGEATASEPGITSGIPFNTTRYTGGAPTFILTQQERYYPMASVNTGIRPPKPQYVWDCMFRRFQGKVMVAIFVYRTTIVGGGDVAYSVPPNPTNPDVPPMPIDLPLTAPWDVFGIDPGNLGDDAQIAVTDPYDTTDQGQSWQEPGQWILDQNNNLHRVLARYRNDNNVPVVELIRPVPSLPSYLDNVFVYYLPGLPNPSVDDVVSNIWYIPREVKLDTNGDGQGDLPVRLTTVYVTVREL